MKLYNKDQAAELLGIAPNSMREYARKYAVGQKVGRDWVFTDEDIEKLRQRPGRGWMKGRPRKEGSWV